MKMAIETSAREHVWADISNEKSLARDREVSAILERKPDVCVLIRASPAHAEDRIFKLSATLRSLQSQHNSNWRAVIYQSDRASFPELGMLIIEALDARIMHVEVSKDVVIPIPEGNDENFLATDWVIRSLANLNPACASARYLLVTTGSNTYEPGAFDSLSQSQDLIGLNVESRQRVWDHPQLQDKTWSSRCFQLQIVRTRVIIIMSFNHVLIIIQLGSKLCTHSAPTLSSFDLSATFFNL